MKKVGCFSILVAAVVLIFAVMAEAQQPKKVSRLGYLSSYDPVADSARSEGIRQALRELGYIEGQSIAIEYRYSEGKVNPELAAELVRLKVELIVVAGGTGIILAAKNATKTIPIVMTGGGSDPVEAGLIESLARPGDNVTGITNLSTNTIPIVFSGVGDPVAAGHIQSRRVIPLLLGQLPPELLGFLAQLSDMLRGRLDPHDQLLQDREAISRGSRFSRQIWLVKGSSS